MVHPGLPYLWGVVVWVTIFTVALWALFAPIRTKPAASKAGLGYPISAVSFVGNALRNLWIRPWLLLPLKLITAAFFLMVIWAGLAGTPLPGRNLATVLTWNLWWTGVIISVMFVGSAWCAVCPWDFLANVMARLRVWRRSHNSLCLRVPKSFRNVWPALALFVGLTWLELGVGITTSPYATAILALAILVLSIILLAVFERKALCHFACPVGRTIGFYAQLAPVELRPLEADVCANCKTLECYYGDEAVDPCPTHLVMGRLKQNTFCTSCGNCARSCPHENVVWRLRPPSHEALEGARPHWDEAWFMLVLLALTGFHGLTMMEFWEGWMRQLARIIGDSGQLLASFSIGMTGAMTLPIALFAGTIVMIRWFTGSKLSFKIVFMRLSFVTLPLAFAYHIAHNLSHLMREVSGSGSVFTNPLGIGALPLSMHERHQQMANMPVSHFGLATVQAILMMLGFWVAVLVIRRRGANLSPNVGASMWPLAPAFGFAMAITAFHLWLLMQPMNMRM